MIFYKVTRNRISVKSLIFFFEITILKKVGDNLEKKSDVLAFVINIIISRSSSSGHVYGRCCKDMFDLECFSHITSCQ